MNSETVLRTIGCPGSRLFFSSLIGVALLGVSTAQEPRTVWQLQKRVTDSSLRGLHVYDDNIVWASGTAGTIVHSFDGGKTWDHQSVPGAEDLDFRDIHAIDKSNIVAMTSGTPARIYRSIDSGKSWKIVFESTDERVFLDAISFFDASRGIAMSDPVEGKLFLLETEDGGKTWRKAVSSPSVESGEAGFAASGTNMTTIGQRVFIGLGSAKENETHDQSRVVFSDLGKSNWQQAIVPVSRSQASGIFSLAFADQQHAIVVGGDYLKPEVTDANFAVSDDGGKTWTVPVPRKPPSGYRSCVAIAHGTQPPMAIAVGPNGTDRSSDFGRSWQRISTVGFHSVEFSKEGRVGWAVGSDGRMGKWIGGIE